MHLMSAMLNRILGVLLLSGVFVNRVDNVLSKFIFVINFVEFILAASQGNFLVGMLKLVLANVLRQVFVNDCLNKYVFIMVFVEYMGTSRNDAWGGMLNIVLAVKLRISLIILPHVGDLTSRINKRWIDNLQELRPSLRKKRMQQAPMDLLDRDPFDCEALAVCDARLKISQEVGDNVGVFPRSMVQYHEFLTNNHQGVRAPRAATWQADLLFCLTDRALPGGLTPVKGTSWKGPCGTVIGPVVQDDLCRWAAWPGLITTDEEEPSRTPSTKVPLTAYFAYYEPFWSVI